MYLGRIVEMGSSEEIITQPRHPYTQALLAAVPGLTRATASSVTHGDIASAAHPPTGCFFHPRCPKAMPVCTLQYPAETRLSKTRVVHCHAVEAASLSIPA